MGWCVVWHHHSAKDVLTVSSNNGQLKLVDTLELEYFRLVMLITPAQRDNVLLELGLTIEDFNPSRFVYLRNETTESTRRKSAKFKSSTCAKVRWAAPCKPCWRTLRIAVQIVVAVCSVTAVCLLLQAILYEVYCDRDDGGSCTCRGKRFSCL